MTHYIWTFSSMHILSNINAIPSDRTPADAQLLLEPTVPLVLWYGGKANYVEHQHHTFGTRNFEWYKYGSKKW